MKSPNAVRQIGNTRASISGVFPFRPGKMIPYESTLERDFLIKLSWRDDILDVQEQPLTIPYITATGRDSTYTPDFLITYKNDVNGNAPRPMLVEVKPKVKLDKELSSLKLKLKAGIKHAKTSGWHFRVYHEARIRDSALKNISFLLRFQHASHDVLEVQHMLDEIRSLDSCTIQAALRPYPTDIDRAQGQAILWHLIATKRVRCL